MSDWRTVGRCMLANYLFVPAMTVALIPLFAPNRWVAAGFLFLACMTVSRSLPSMKVITR
ncbi:MAG: hypothetical protein AB2L14_12770 [Candidatus Xenobiia bacterium LiM19]